MRIELLDYGSSRKAFNIPEKGDILVAIIQILSGDEVLKTQTDDWLERLTPPAESGQSNQGETDGEV